MYRFLVKLITTFFFIGYLPLIPGTFGSLAGLLICFILRDNFFFYLLFTVLLLIIGFSLSGKAANLFSRRDPPCVVIDEIAAVLLSFLFLPITRFTLIIGFFIFRILDAIKPYPANKIHHSSGSIAIMADDIIAAIYTNLILQAIIRLPLPR